MTRWIKGLAIAGALSALLAASTHAQTAAPVPAAPAKAASKQTPAPAGALPALPADPELADPAVDTTKRLDRSIGNEAVGGADCRTGCDKTYYTCLSLDDSGQCPVTWAQCQAACPEHSSNF